MSTERAPVTNIIFGTMTLGYQGYGSRVHDTETAAAMLNVYSDVGYRALDTAHAYGGGSGEQMHGDLRAAQRFTIATRYDPQGANHAQERDKLKAAFRLSLTRTGPRCGGLGCRAVLIRAARCGRGCWDRESSPGRS
jgi:aflatoxin B1 aldehyde reductase